MINVDLSQKIVTMVDNILCRGVGEYEMFKGRHFDQSVILLCVRWYLAYNLSLRNLEEMMAERGLSIDHSTVHRWFFTFRQNCLNGSIDVNGLLQANGISMKPISKFAENGCICTGQSTALGTRSSSSSARTGI